MFTVDNVKIQYDEIKNFCSSHHIKKLSLFGSAVRNELTPNSDIDILVEFDRDNIPGLFEIIHMEKKLSSLFDNREVDLRTSKDLSHYIREEVLEEAEVLYSEI